MAKQQKSALMAKMGNVLRTAHEQHKDDVTEFSQFGDLPPGIQNGIARIVEVKFDTYKKGDMQGEFFFYAAGTVVSPTHVKTKDGMVQVQGLRTSIMEPLCDTPKRSRATAADHLAWIYNEMRKLGVDTSQMTVDELEETAAALKEAQPHFRFRTWQGEATKEYPDPRVNHQWEGAFDYQPEETDDEVSDTSDEVTEVPDVVEDEPAPAPLSKPAGPASKIPVKTPPKAPPTAPAAPTPKPTPGPKKPATPAPSPAPAKKATKAAPPPPPPEPAPEFDDMGDIESLLERSNNGDEEAQNRLAELAIEQGYSEEEVSAAESWDAVQAMAMAPKPDDLGEGDEAAEEEAVEEVSAPAVGEVWSYQPTGAKKPVDCEVTAVDSKKETVTLKNLTNPKMIYKAVPFSALIGG